MEINYGVTGKQRKALVMAIAEITGAEAIYKGVPTCSYEVDYFTIDRYGTVSFDDRADSEEIEHLLESISERGFTAEITVQVEPLELGKDLSKETKESKQNETVGLTVALPLDKVSVENLNALLDAKGHLLKKALGIDELPIEVSEDRVSFPWFTQTFDADSTKAYTHLIAALGEMSMKQKRINNTEKNVENEKYAFRCFLLRLGFIGAEYKAERKILLQNLSGSSAFKSGEKKEVVADEISE